MAYIVALANQKGGVGKTTTAVNLGAALVGLGKRVLLIDLDPQANATSHLGYRRGVIEQSVYNVLVGRAPIRQATLHTTRLHLDLLPAITELAGAEVEMVGMMAREQLLSKALAPVTERYDYILLDPPPSLGLLTVNALTAADGIIVPIQAEYLALEGLAQLINTLNLVQEQLNPELEILGLLITMYDARTNLAAGVAADIRSHYPDKVFDTHIPRNVRLSEAPSHGSTIFELDPRSSGAEAYAKLAGEVLSRLGDSAQP